MKYILFFFLFSILSFAQVQEDLIIQKKDNTRRSLREAPKQAPKAPYDNYRIITLERDTTYVDTSLTIRKEYDYNYLRKDNFGLISFHNDGHTYNTLDFGLNKKSVFPEFGFKAKHFNYSKAEEVNYYSVATPMTELYFKTVLEQGQSVDAFITLNTSERLNLSIAYKGLRSLGKYINSLASTGNFRFTTSYFTKNKRYYANFHYVAQDILNQENGGLVTLENFESGDGQFTDRARIDVNLSDAQSLLKGKRYFIDHSFVVNPKSIKNNVSLTHQMSYETKFFEFKKGNAGTLFGVSSKTTNIQDLTKSNILYNKISGNFTNSIIGNFNFFVENYQHNYFYNRIVISNNLVVIPNTNNDNLNSLGGKYFYNKGKLNGEATFSKSISNQTFSTLDLKANYKLNEKNSLDVQYQNISKVPDLNYNLYQSTFNIYNWKNNFKNEKTNSILIKAKTEWLHAEANITAINDYLYFSNDTIGDKRRYTTPKQYNKAINYLSIKVNKEFKFRKFALDNSILYQEVDQKDNILNVPKLVTRNTIYYTTDVFKKAMLLQTGFTFQYFSKYYANEHNPIIGEFYVQNTKKIGDFPLVDFFINARVRQTRIYLKAEHFNAAFTGRNYYATPTQPYRDFIIRFGLVWNFFQ